MDSRSFREHQLQEIDAEIKSLKHALTPTSSLPLSIRALKYRRNALAPISSLPAELIAAIFSYLRLPSNTTPLSSLPALLYAELFPSFPDIDRRPDCPTDWLCATHVCHQWREIALNDPLFWNYVDFTDLTSAGATEILTRAKEMPLHLEARDTFWQDDTRRGAFENQLQSRFSYIYNLHIRAEEFHLRRIFNKLALPAPILEQVSFSQDVIWGFPWEPISIPDTLFNGTAPRLSRLELRNVDISWRSPLLKGLRYLEIRAPSENARPRLAVWLDALDEMPSLESLVLHSASPIAPPFPFDIKRTVTLPSLTHLDISASAGNCALALAHLTLPALTKLCLTAESRRQDGSDVKDLFPHVAQHVRGFRDTQPLQSAFIQREGIVTTVLAWPLPDMDIKVNMGDPAAFFCTALSAQVALFIISNTPTPSRHRGHLLSTAILDTLITALPLDSIVTLTIRHDTRLDTQFWLRHAQKWPLLQRVELTHPEARGFRELLLQGNGSWACEDPLLPSLTELVLIEVTLSEHRTLCLCDALMARVEQGVPLETLDLRLCQATRDAVDLLGEIVVDVLEPVIIARVFPSLWNQSRRLFILDDSSGEEDYSDDDVAEEGQESEDYSDMGEDWYASHTS